jgi:hypothetical protein
MTSSPFDNRRDERLGRLLKETLSGSDDAAFVRRVMAGVDLEGVAGAQPWEVLSGWARPGLAAAIGIAAGVVLWLSAMSEQPSSTVPLGDPLPSLAEAEVPAVLVASPQPPSLDDVLAAGLGN